MAAGGARYSLPVQNWASSITSTNEQRRRRKTLAAELDADPTLLYRLLRAQAAIGLLEEDGSQGFVLTDEGELLRSDHPQSLKPMARLEEGPQHYALWKHLPAMVRDGKQNAFIREFGRMAFDMRGRTKTTPSASSRR